MKRFILLLAAVCFTLPAFGQTKQFNQYGVEVEIDPLAAEAQDGILVLRSQSDSGYKIWFDNRVQPDGAVFFGAPD